MRQTINSLIITGFFIFATHAISFSQELSAPSNVEIKKEISKIFEKSIEAGEKLDVNEISENINDSLTCFIHESSL